MHIFAGCIFIFLAGVWFGYGIGFIRATYLAIHSPTPRKKVRVKDLYPERKDD